MRRSDQGLVGVELHQREIRAVQVRFRGGTPHIVNAAHCPMPAESLVRGQITNPSAVAVALQRLLESMGIKGEVGIGLASPSIASIFRRLTLPPAPTAEMAAMVAGEVAHYQILRTNGAHDFFRLESPVQEGGEEMAAVIVAAAEEAVVQGVKQMAEQLSLPNLSFEPLHFAMLRAAVAALPQTDVQFVVMVGDAHTDLALMYQGKPWFYRRIDLGSDALKAAALVSAEVRGEEIEDETIAPLNLGFGPASDLATEIHRSLDYIEREYAGLPAPTSLNLVVNEPELEFLGDFLAQRSNMPCQVVTPGLGSFPSDVPDAMSGPEGIRYAAAFGLAVREGGNLVQGAPKVDLLSELRDLDLASTERKILVGSLVASALAIVFGGTAWVLYGNQIKSMEAEAVAAIDRAEKINSEATAERERRALRAEQHTLLKREGVPLTALMDYLQGGIQPGVGLVSVTVDPQLGVTIAGDSMTEAALINTVSTLQRVPVLQGVAVQSFNRDQRGMSDGILFTLASRTVSLDAIAEKAPQPVASALPVTPGAPVATTAGPVGTQGGGQ